MRTSAIFRFTPGFLLPFLIIALCQPSSAKIKPDSNDLFDTINETAVETPFLTGYARVERSSGYIFVEAMASGGKRGYFLVDFAAGITVVARSFLPDDSDISGLKTDHGRPGDPSGTTDALMGLGGTVGGYLGIGRIRRLHFGTLRFNDVPVEVVESLPRVGYRRISGILGLDLLTRAEAVSIDLRRSGKKPTRIRFTSRSVLKGKDAIEVPYMPIGNHIFLRLKINGRSVQFLFDTGSRETLIPADLAESVSLYVDASKKKRFYGLDGGPIDTYIGIADTLELGNAKFSNIRMFITEGSAMHAGLISRKFGILGNGFFSRFSAVEIDFKKRILLLVE